MHAAGPLVAHPILGAPVDAAHIGALIEFVLAPLLALMPMRVPCALVRLERAAAQPCFVADLLRFLRELTIAQLLHTAQEISKVIARHEIARALKRYRIVNVVLRRRPFPLPLPPFNAVHPVVVLLALLRVAQVRVIAVWPVAVDTPVLRVERVAARYLDPVIFGVGADERVIKAWREHHMVVAFEQVLPLGYGRGAIDAGT